MPQILFLVAVGFVAYLSYKALAKSSKQAADRLRRARQEAENEAIGTLEKDPVTGEYRVRKE